MDFGNGVRFKKDVYDGIMMNNIGIILIILIAWNIIVFAVYGMDKSRAKRNERRISEKTLLLSAALFGGAGALLGMYIFRHKTKHLKFKIGVPLLLIVNIVIVVTYMRIYVF